LDVGGRLRIHRLGFVLAWLQSLGKEVGKGTPRHESERRHGGCRGGRMGVPALVRTCVHPWSVLVSVVCIRRFLRDPPPWAPPSLFPLDRTSREACTLRKNGAPLERWVWYMGSHTTRELVSSPALKALTPSAPKSLTLSPKPRILNLQP